MNIKRKLMFDFDDNEELSNSERQELDEKLKLYCRAIRNPRKDSSMVFDITTIENLIEYCLDDDKFEEALDLARLWIEIVPNSAEAYAKKAFILLNLDRSREALIAINEALNIDDEDLESLLLKALILDYSPDFSGFFHFYAKGVAVGADMVENVGCSA